MKSVAWMIALLAVLLLGPLLLREKPDGSSGRSDETLIIITPHNEATRYEFARAFREAHFRATGRRVFIDWRTTGGTSEIARYVAAQYLGSFRNYWTNTLHRPWTPECAAFDDAKATAPAAIEARKAFLDSNAGCGMDLFFGGGSFDYMQMAAAGRLVDSGIVRAHPELFNLATVPKPGGATLTLSGSNTLPLDFQRTDIPNVLGGETLWDPKGRWIGACLGAFGICYNTDSISRLGVDHPPAQWADLADPAYANELALADPTQSGSVAKAFEMILQQQIAAAVRSKSPSEPEPAAIARGWTAGMRLIQRISANARYFTDGATDIPYSVQAGDATAGMCIDFYGRFESESVRKPDGTSRLAYVTPAGGSSTGADSIGMFRGAPHAELAREFMEFTLSQDGQKLWCFRAGIAGGPEKYTLRRLPIRPDMYESRFKHNESDPDVNPYKSEDFQYQARWTGSLFTVISFAIRCAFIEPHDELKSAWASLARNHFPPHATAVFGDLTAIDYPTASGAIRDALRSPDKLTQTTLARTLDEHFRAQYLQAATLAKSGQ
jgi:ABC-type Fe3+ transport system substrate-binding protein